MARNWRRGGNDVPRYAATYLSFMRKLRRSIAIALDSAKNHPALQHVPSWWNHFIAVPARARTQGRRRAVGPRFRGRRLRA